MATAVGGADGIEPRLERGVLRGDADRTAAGVAVGAAARLGAQRGVVGADVDGCAGVVAVGGAVAAQGEERGHADGDGVGTEGEGLGHVGARADAARDDQLDLVAHADVAEGLGGHAHGGQGGDAGVLDEDVLGGRGAALHAVDHDDICAGGHGQLHVMVDPGGADFDVDRDGPVGGLAQLLDLDAQVVGADPVGVAAGRALVDAGRAGCAYGPPAR